MNYNDTVREVERASIALRSVEERYDTVKRQIEIQIEAFALIPKDFDDNKTIIYYSSERERVAKKLETENASVESQLMTLDAKKNAAIDAIEREFNSKVSALEAKKENAMKSIEIEYSAKLNSLEAKKEQMSIKLGVEAERYSKEIERVQASLENPEPQTPLFRKLKADMVKLEKEKMDAELVFSDKLALRRQAEEKKHENMQREYQEKMRMMEREQHIRDEETRKRIEQDKENERKKEEARAIERCKAAKVEWVSQQPTEIVAAPPRPLKKGKMVRPKGVAPMMPLDITKKYRYDDLMAIVIDYDTIAEYEEEVYDKACAYAARREKINGWASLRHNLTAEGDLISEEEFANIYK